MLGRMSANSMDFENGELAKGDGERGEDPREWLNSKVWEKNSGMALIFSRKSSIGSFQ